MNFWRSSLNPETKLLSLRQGLESKLENREMKEFVLMLLTEMEKLPPRMRLICGDDFANCYTIPWKKNTELEPLLMQIEMQSTQFEHCDISATERKGTVSVKKMQVIWHDGNLVELLENTQEHGKTMARTNVNQQFFYNGGSGIYRPLYSQTKLFKIELLDATIIDQTPRCQAQTREIFFQPFGSDYHFQTWQETTVISSGSNITQSGCSECIALPFNNLILTEEHLSSQDSQLLTKTLGNGAKIKKDVQKQLGLYPRIQISSGDTEND